MQPPHYYELIDVVNSKKGKIELYSCDDKLEAYGVKTYGVLEYMNNKGSLEYSGTGIRVNPKNLSTPAILGRVDLRKKKLFKFEDYADIYMLAESVAAYIEAAREKYIINYKPKFLCKYSA